MDWQPPFPLEELDVRAMCGDPAAQAYKDLLKFLEGLDPPLDPYYAMDAVFHDHFGNNTTRYEILRHRGIVLTYIPQDMSIKLYNDILVHLILENLNAVSAQKAAAKSSHG